MKTTSRLWLALFIAVTVPLLLYLFFSLRGDDRRVFMPAPVSYAHHQIELACTQCHDEAFSGNDAIEKRCRDCHQDALQAMNDAHGKKKFSDPRNADWLAVLDARQCLSCHEEHVPERTSAMALTQPRDFCIACHADIGKERDSHRDLAANSCLNSGCHNYHDATTLHEKFLGAQMAIPDVQRPHQRLSRPFKPQKKWLPDRDNHGDVNAERWQTIVSEWSMSQHASSKGNCSDCHNKSDDWSVADDACKTCHADQLTQFGQGRHGMRAALNLSAMTIAQAQLPMDLSHGDKTLQCHSCHAAHDFNTQKAEADACLSCHNDEHSVAWRESAHAKTWASNAERGASCATCHMPRHKADDGNTVHVQHNQSANLRPNDKMLKTVCLNCHGIDMAMAALADPAQIRNNFQQPATTHTSLDWVRLRQQNSSNTNEGKTP